MNNPTKGIKPSEAMIKKLAVALAAYRSCNFEYGQYVECASCRNGKGYDDDVGCLTLAQAALSSIPDPLAVIDALCEALKHQSKRFDEIGNGHAFHGVADIALAAAEQFKKEWSGE